MNESAEKQLTNPAKRLHSILAGAALQQQSGQPFRNYLSAILGGNPQNDLEMFRKLLGLYDLVALTDRRLSTMKHHKRQTYAGCINPIVTTLQQMQLNSPASQITQQLGGGPLLILDLASDALDQEQPEFELEQPALDSLYADAQQFESRVQASDLSAELRRLLLDSIGRIKTAIENYKLGGLEGLDRAIKEAYGAGFVEREIVLPQKDNPLVRDYWDWLGKTTDTMSACRSAYSGRLIGGDVIIHLLEDLDR